jgi:sucrose phosphorylase
MNAHDRIREHLRLLYGGDSAKQAWKKLEPRLARFRRRHPHFKSSAESPAEPLTERDGMLITYGDQVTEPNRPPLQTLAEFLNAHTSDTIGDVHLLPHFPYSSDDGFSVIDYRQVDPKLGSWSDVERLERKFRLMFDAVINHVSRQSAWFQGFVRGEPPYTDYFIVVDPAEDLSKVVRPRALPLLTTVETSSGTKHVWTTFSEDQIDLNYRNPDVLIEIIDVLLLYVARGAQFLRLDAIAFLWKEIGTTCIHLPQTHRVIQLFRAVLDEVAPGVMLITETNVPHQDNISYFGDGTNEAQLVYNFALPPLVLHTFHTGNATALSQWAASLTLPSDRVTFFNFLASHDGIGINPARGILPGAAIDAMVERVRAHGGLVSYKSNPDGTQSPYELNVNWFDALSDPRSHEGIDVQVDRFIASQAIMLSLMGMPGIYFHSFFGSRGWPEGVKETGRNRTINRQKFDRAELERDLSDLKSLRHRVFARYRRLLMSRASSPAFNPYAPQQIVECGEAVFAVLRTARDEKQKVLCLHNVTNQPQIVRVDFRSVLGAMPATGASGQKQHPAPGLSPKGKGVCDLGENAIQTFPPPRCGGEDQGEGDPGGGGKCKMRPPATLRDLVSGENCGIGSKGELSLGAYQCRWLIE